MPINRKMDSDAEARTAQQPPFDRLRCALATLPPTGDNGFEGLMAAACSQLAGVPFRLVSSGRQFGRDAEGAPSGATVMMEAKRYNTKLSYDALSTKLLEALERSRRNVEVWCAAATVAFDAADSGDLRTMGETRGTTVLVLDWAQPLPPLGVMLAAACETVVDWFARNTGASAADVERELASIRADPLYDERAATVRAEFRSASIGLAVARRGNAEWMSRHFSDVLQALHRFNQPLAPLDDSIRPAPLERARLEGRIRDAIGTWSPEPRVVILTGQPERGLGGRGDEGVGKSWAAARSWLTFPDAAHRPRPLLLFMTPHMWREGDERTPMALLARLAAEQTGASTAGDPVRWQTKLERWLTPSDEPGSQTPVIVLVLDGVNERIHHPWVPLISALALEARSRRLSIVVTTRRGIYDRDFAPRLKLFDVCEIPVEAFSDDELDHLLVQDGKRPEEVREPLRSFLRNPRVLSVGLDLLDRLDPDEVGIERLLFEYLRKRQDGRSLAGGHTAEQLEQVLVRHAREIRDRLLSQVGARQSAEFEDRTIHDRLGLPAGQTNLAVDLGDIVDSGFIRIVDGRRGKYALRENGRLLGLGLLVVEELAAAVEEDAADLDRLLEAIIDPIRAIDETALVLLSALDVAIADPGIDDEVRAVLLHQVLTLQNIPAGQQARIFAGLSDRPEVFTRVAGRLFGERSRTGRREWMRDKLVEARDRPGTAEAIDLAVRNWLRAWQREPSPPDLDGYGEEQAANARKAHEEATSRHEQDLQDLTDAERAYVERALVPLERFRFNLVHILRLRRSLRTRQV